MSTGDRHYDVTVIAGTTLEGTDCLVLHKSGELEPAEPAEAVNNGNAGVVYRAQWQHGIDVALKLLSPKRDVIASVDTDAFKSTFTREIALLSRVTHTRIAKILFSGDARLNGSDVPFYAMEFVEGERFGDAVASGTIDGLTFLSLFDQILDGVEYLHERRFMHADLKSENILVREQFGQLDVKIVDLGVAKVLDDEASVGPDEGTYFYSTRRITRPEWHQRLGKKIPRVELEGMFPYHDLFALGVLIDEVLKQPAVCARVSHDLGRPALTALGQIRDRLTADPEDGAYPSVRALRADWQKLQPRYLSPLGVPELALGAQAETSIATPAGRVSLTERTLALINHPMMQRLRNIPQLEFAHLIYPGATHTRLLHSVSTFDVARRFTSNLMRDATFRLLVDPAEVEATLLMALCHDVGHYPLSHMFEDWSYQEAQAGEPRRIPTDDDLFWALVDPAAKEDAPFAEYAEVVSEALGSKVPAFSRYLFQSGRFSTETLDALRGFKILRDPSQRLLRAILDSQIDADKIAYLTDDSLMTGVRYGLGIDLDALFAALRAPRSTDMPTGNTSVIALNDKGLPAAEQIMLARYWMLRRVYWHHTNRAVMGMVKFAIAVVEEAAALDMGDYFRATATGGPREGLDYLNAAFNTVARESGNSLVNPLPGLEGANRGLYKRILTFARGDDGRAGAMFEALATRRSTALLAVMDCARETLAGVIGAEVAKGEVLVDVPLKERARTSASTLVYLRKSSSPVPIEQASPIVEHLLNEFDAHARKARLYVAPALHERLSDLGLDRVRDALLPALEEHCGIA